MAWFNFSSIKSAKVHVAPAGFRYGYIENLFNDDFYENLVETFCPTIKFCERCRQFVAYKLK